MMIADPNNILQNQQPSLNEQKRKMMAQMLMSNQQPVRGWGDAIGNMAQSAAGAYGMMGKTATPPPALGPFQTTPLL